jgi:hypothetical protein
MRLEYTEVRGLTNNSRICTLHAVSNGETLRSRVLTEKAVAALMRKTVSHCLQKFILSNLHKKKKKKRQLLQNKF